MKANFSLGTEIGKFHLESPERDALLRQMNQSTYSKSAALNHSLQVFVFIHEEEKPQKPSLSKLKLSLIFQGIHELSKPKTKK